MEVNKTFGLGLIKEIKMSKVIGLIGAMDVEVELITNELQNVETKVLAGKKFHKGMIDGVEVVAVVSGIGKVNAAMCTQKMIDEYNPQIIINSGIAGSLKSNIKIADIVIADKLCQHDLDITLGEYEGGKYQPGQLSVDKSPFLTASKSLVKQLYDIAASEIGEDKVFIGTIATGDQFVYSTERKDFITKYFDGSAVEMESGSIAYVCQENNVDYAVLRAISDNADEDAPTTFDEFAEQAAHRGANIFINFVKKNA